MIAVASYQRALAIWRECDMAGARLRITEVDLASRRELVAGHSENRNGAFTAVCDQRQCASVVDRYARGAKAGFQCGNNRRRPGLEVDYRKPVIRNGLFRISRIDLEGSRHQRKNFRHAISRRSAAARPRWPVP